MAVRGGAAKTAGLAGLAVAGVVLAFVLSGGVSEARASQNRAAGIGVSLSVVAANFYSIGVQATLTGVTSPVTVSLDWGLTSAYEFGNCCATTYTPGNAQPGFGRTNLQPATTYHFRVDVQDSGGAIYQSGDLAVTTAAIGPPLIALYSPSDPAAVFNPQGYPAGAPCWSASAIQVNTKGLDTTWFATVGPDLANPWLTYNGNGVIPAWDSDGFQWGGGALGGFSMCMTNAIWLTSYPGEVVYLQLHATNSAGQTNGPTYTYTLPGATTTTTTTGTTTTTATTTTATTTARTTTTVPTTTTAPPTTTMRTPSSKVVLPNSTRTPGAVNPAVTQQTIKQTICVASWIAKVRPPVSYTNALKLKQMKQYGAGGKPSAYEEDQFIPLELGGAPKNPKNLWPEPYSQARHSDPLEKALKLKVCAGRLTLTAARKQIAAYKRKHG
jgi:hypothetical protein